MDMISEYSDDDVDYEPTRSIRRAQNQPTLKSGRVTKAKGVIGAKKKEPSAPGGNSSTQLPMKVGK